MLHNVIQTYNTISVIDWNIKINQALCVKTCNKNEEVRFLDIVTFIGDKLNQTQTARVQTGLEVPCEALYLFYTQ